MNMCPQSFPKVVWESLSPEAPKKRQDLGVGLAPLLGHVVMYFAQLKMDVAMHLRNNSVISLPCCWSCPLLEIHRFGLKIISKYHLII